MMFLEKELERRRIIIEELRKKNEDLHEEIVLRNKENNALKLDREAECHRKEMAQCRVEIFKSIVDQKNAKIDKAEAAIADLIALNLEAIAENDKLKAEREEYLPIDWCIREGTSGIPKAFSLKDTTGQTLGEYISRLKSNADTHLDLLKKQQAKCKELQAKYDELMNSCGVVFREDNKPTEFKVDDCLYRFNSSNDMAFAIMQFHRDLKETREKLKKAEDMAEFKRQLDSLVGLRDK